MLNLGLFSYAFEKLRQQGENEEKAMKVEFGPDGRRDMMDETTTLAAARKLLFDYELSTPRAASKMLREQGPDLLHALVAHLHIARGRVEGFSKALEKERQRWASSVVIKLEQEAVKAFLEGKDEVAVALRGMLTWVKENNAPLTFKNETIWIEGKEIPLMVPEAAEQPLSATGRCLGVEEGKFLLSVSGNLSGELLKRVFKSCTLALLMADKPKLMNSLEKHGVVVVDYDTGASLQDAFQREGLKSTLTRCK